MMFFSFALHIPFSRRQWQNVWVKEVSVSKNKSLEMQLVRNRDLIGLTADIRFWGQSHAGPSFDFSLLGWEFMIGLHDHRHWNNEEWRWCRYDKPEEW